MNYDHAFISVHVLCNSVPPSYREEIKNVNEYVLFRKQKNVKHLENEVSHQKLTFPAHHPP